MPENRKALSPLPGKTFHTPFQAGLLADRRGTCVLAPRLLEGLTQWRWRRSMRNTVMAVAPDSNRLPFSPEGYLRAPERSVELSKPSYHGLGGESICNWRGRLQSAYNSITGGEENVGAASPSHGSALRHSLGCFWHLGANDQLFGLKAHKVI